MSSMFNMKLIYLLFTILFRSIVYSTLEANDPSEPTLPFYNIPLKGVIDEGYSAAMDIGTPPQTFNLLIDTGSSNLAVAGTPVDYVPSVFLHKQSSTFSWLSDRVSVQYSQGYWEGELARDQLKFSALPTRPITAEFAVIDYSEDFFSEGTDWQGILGLGYETIAEEGVEPFWVSYIREHIFKDIFSLSLCGLQSKTHLDQSSPDGRSKDDDEAQGTLTLGGADPDVFVGSMQFTPIVRPDYFEVLITDVKVNHDSLRLDCKEYNFPRSIVDSGTTNLRLPARVFDAVIYQLTSYVQTTMTDTELPEDFWGGDEVICWEPSNEKFNLFPTLSISFLDITSTNSTPTFFDVTIVPEQYLSPVVFNGQTLTPESKCFRLSISRSDEGTVLGSTFMEGFYVKFDRANSRIGFAVSKCTRYANLDKPPAVSEIRTLDVSQIGNNYNPPFDLLECKFNMYEPDERPILIAAYVLISIACLCLLPIIVTFVHGQFMECRDNDYDHDSEDRDQLVK